ncbi:hypothetical protein AXE65_08235 [Ventosimonas gracilis]|uniref:Uncharacterized protein n=1 Tax=Ventosimonas gracilis TaxID=1680762 RepID=A0A139SYK3_9GAMM|nr:Imm9 family immunity protein [Ventosimonas gracilis]KXU39482.1 hypothetical protein AXE65_08235 [Ventosimonas gracilis]
MKAKQVMACVSRCGGVDNLYLFIDRKSIEKKLNAHIESILPRINTEGLAGWGLDLIVNFQCTDFIVIDNNIGESKGDSTETQCPICGDDCGDDMESCDDDMESNKHSTETERLFSKKYEASIIIPIPDNTQAPYGMWPYESWKIGDFSPASGTDCHLLDPEYDQYSGLEQYILVSAIKAIDFGFSKGFTCAGKEIIFSRLIDAPILIPADRGNAIKYKQARVRMEIELPGLDDVVDIDSINNKLNAYVESIAPSINIECLSGWMLVFHVNHFCVDLIAVYKKLSRDSAEKEYIIPIAIPLPDNTQAAYGMLPGEDGKTGSFRPVESNHFYPLDPEYDQYDNLEQYIIESVIKAIDFGLSKGFVIGKEISFRGLSAIINPAFPLSRSQVVLKYQQVRARMSIEVQRLGHFADMESVGEKIDAYVESILPRINIEDLPGWRLFLLTDYLCTDFIGIDEKFKWYPSVKECGISIVIPIPDNTQAPYGILPDRDVKIGCFRPARSNYSHVLDPEYEQYVSLEQYMVASVIKAIDFGFSKGFDCDGGKIKFQD